MLHQKSRLPQDEIVDMMIDLARLGKDSANCTCWARQHGHLPRA